MDTQVTKAKNSTKNRSVVEVVDLPPLPESPVVIEGSAITNAVIIAPPSDETEKPSVQPTLIVDRPLDPNDKPDNSAPIVVPAPLTPAQIAAAELLAACNVAFVAFQNAIPSTAAAEFIAPDDDAVDALAEAYAKEHSVKLRVAYATIEDQIAQNRAAHEKLISDSRLVNRDYYRAAYNAITTLRGGVEKLLIDAGGMSSSEVSSVVKPTSNSTTPRAGRAGIDWAKLAPTLLKWASDNGLHGFYFIDKASGGYKDKYHALRLRGADQGSGVWEVCTYDPATNIVPQPTGEYVKSPLYYNSDGDPISTHGGNVPNVGGPMRAFVVPMIAADGKSYIYLDNVNEKNTSGVKNYALPETVFKDCDIPTGR